MDLTYDPPASFRTAIDQLHDLVDVLAAAAGAEHAEDGQ